MWLVCADIFRRMPKAAMWLVAFATALVLAPEAMAHGSRYATSVLSIPASATANGAARRGASDAAIQSVTYVQSATATLAGPGESCPEEPGHSHSGDAGCCASIACCIARCVSACGAMSPAEDPISFLLAELALPSSTTLFSVGIDTIPTDPPPRPSI